MAEIVQANSLALLTLVQCLVEMLQGELVDDKKAFAYALLAFLLVGHLAFLNLYMIFLCKPSEGIGIAQLLVLHDKVNRLAAFAASEALP